MTSTLAHSRYGKDKVRVFRIVRDGKWHHVVEYNVTALLEGDVETRYVPPDFLGRGRQWVDQGPGSYTQADNTVVVATDSSEFYCAHNVSKF